MRPDWLRTDPIARIGLVAVAAYTLLYAIPFLSPGPMEEFSQYWSELPLILLLPLALARWRRISRRPGAFRWPSRRMATSRTP